MNGSKNLEELVSREVFKNVAGNDEIKTSF
jgi:hypothetical protein